MRYEEWIDTLKQLENSNKEELLNKVINSEYNENINAMLEDHIVETIKIKFQKAINKIVKNLEDIFFNVNNLDMYLVNYRKEISFIERLIKIKQLKPEKQKELKDMIKEETTKVYEILIKEANIEDPTGLNALTIKNNQIKWSD